MKKLKVAFLLLTCNWSGAERVISELLKSMVLRKDVQITLLTNGEMVPFYSGIKNIKIINLGKLYTKNILLMRFILPFLFKRIEKELKKSKFDILSLHGESPIEFGGKLKGSSYQIISTFHGSDLFTFSDSFLKNSNLIMAKGIFYFIKMIYYKCRIKPLFLRALNRGKITLVGKEQIGLLPTQYHNKTIVIPNGVDSEVFRPLKNIKQKKNVILFVGRFIDIKGINEIINVAKQLPQYEFWFAGQGPLSKEIKGDNIKNLGFKTTEELVRLYNQATICIFPSHYESFGLVGLEAMSCRKTVITTPPGFSEFIKDKEDGLIIPPRNEDALKNAIIDLMVNKEKRKILEKNARKKALKYSWDKVSDKYLRLFRSIVK